MSSKPRVVVTGVAGFIGSHLAETLLDRGYAVVGIDNLLTGDLANIAHLANRDFHFIKHDVTNFIYLDGPVDYVLHWASPASPIDYLELPIQTLKVGALGTHNTLGLAKAAKLFPLFAPRRYVAVDISVDFLKHSLECLQRAHPDMDMLGVGLDFSAALARTCASQSSTSCRSRQ